MTGALLVSILMATSSPSLTLPPELLEVRPPTISEMITDASKKWGVSEKEMRRVINCESEFNPRAVGDGGRSHGLVQIFLPAHPHITKAQAQDPEFAITFLAKNLAAGKGRMWSCY